jgi:hypothetical protein
MIALLKIVGLIYLKGYSYKKCEINIRQFVRTTSVFLVQRLQFMPEIQQTYDSYDTAEGLQKFFCFLIFEKRE